MPLWGRSLPICHTLLIDYELYSLFEQRVRYRISPRVPDETNLTMHEPGARVRGAYCEI